MAYDGRALFADITTEVAFGQMVLVTGSNGSGKTTFLKIIAGLVRPTDGEIGLTLPGGVKLEDVTERRRVIGYAGPDVNPYDELTAEENLLFHARLRGVLPWSVAEREGHNPLREGVSARGVLDRVGLQRRKQGEQCRTFSSGMRQRVRLAVSLVGSPSILIWDEPTAMLDEDGRTMASAILAQHVRDGGIAFVATNDASEIERWGDRRIHFGGR